MKKILFGLLIFNLFIFTITALPKTYAYWTSPLASDTVCNSKIKIGSWKKFLILEEVGQIANPEEGIEFIYQNQFYVVLWDLKETIPNDNNWWGWENPWSGVNRISKAWLDSNYYDERSLPVLKDGSYYLAIDAGATNCIPGSDPFWFKVSEVYLPTNIYHKGYITKYGFDFDGNPRYWLAKQYVNLGYTPGDYPWAWQEILVWEGSAKMGEIVYHEVDGTIRFWKALKTNNLEPTDSSAKSGYFLEIKNGWIFPKTKEIANVWLEHNQYQPGDIVTFGVDNCLRYRFFRSVKSSIGEVPFTIIGSKETLNDEYWQEIRFNIK